jgi:cellulose synthase/poly-beta-1,6-N-acetylglucosamine synthase-like glycosyltransferase
MLKCLFWLSAFLAVFSYFIYPLVLKLNSLSGAKRVKPDASSPLPAISLIITAYNEEHRIEKKINNSLELNYSGPFMEIIVASDCSDDKTDEWVQSYANRGVKLVRAQERLGKENAQLAAISIAQGDILVFSDVATEIPSDAIEHLIKYFSDPDIGAVSSEDRFISQDGSIAGEGAYVKYEMWLRQLESMQAGLVGLSGSFFAARKSVCQSWDIYSPSDFNTALNTAKAGLRAVSAPDVLGYYQDLKDPAKEYARKVRTVIRGMTGLWRHKEVLNIGAMGFFAFQVLSHKLMRWLTPWFLLSTFILNALTANNGFIYSLAFLLQLFFYGCALAAHFLPELRNIGPIKIIYFFVQVNIALLDASLKFSSGQRMTTWKPSAR